MAQAIKSALPSHLKPQLGGKDSEAEFAGRHHGKTRSHMVSSTTGPSGLLRFDSLPRELSMSLQSPAHPIMTVPFRETYIHAYIHKELSRVPFLWSLPLSLLPYPSSLHSTNTPSALDDPRLQLHFRRLALCLSVDPGVSAALDAHPSLLLLSSSANLLLPPEVSIRRFRLASDSCNSIHRPAPPPPPSSLSTDRSLPHAQTSVTPTADFNFVPLPS